MKKIYILPIFIVLLPFIGLLLLLNLHSNGPDLNGEERFYGCYRDRELSIKVNKYRISELSGRNGLNIVRFFYLKVDPAIEVMGSIKYNSDKGILDFSESSGTYFYKFYENGGNIYFIIPEISGKNVELIKSYC